MVSTAMDIAFGEGKTVWALTPVERLSKMAALPLV